MRRISFGKTQAQFLAGTKTVTRRLGWHILTQGMPLLAVDRAMGLKKGQKAKVLGEIEVVSVRREPLSAITPADVVAEGFPHWTPAEFVKFFCRFAKCTPDTEVTRIEFRTISTTLGTEDGKIAAIELFSCAGGMAEGFRRAGIDVAMAIDKDGDACDSYEANMGHRPLQLDVRELWPLSPNGVRLPEHDLLIADPPCSPWSLAGNRKGLDDERDCMLPTVELIHALRPRAFLIGNVPGLEAECNLAMRQRIFGPLHAAGYCIDYRLLNAANFGVPQKRKRPFWFGHLGGPCLKWPRPTHADPRKLATPLLLASERLPAWVTVRQAFKLEGLPRELWGRRVSVNRALRTGGNGSHRVPTIDEPARTVTTGKTHYGNHYQWPWDRPCTTITTDPRLIAPGHHGSSGKGYSKMFGPDALELTEEARRLLQGFPPGWRFCGKSRASRNRQIGMAMPPPLAEAVARSIAAWFASQEDFAINAHDWAHTA